MSRWSKRDLMVGAALAVALSITGACDAPQGGHGGSGAFAGTGAGGPACADFAVGSDARFTQTSGPDRAAFTAVAATSAVVIATTGSGVHRSRDGGETWTYVGAEQVRGKKVTAMASVGDAVFVATPDAVFRTNDGGDTWVDASSVDCASPGYLSGHDGRLFATCQGRPFEWDAAGSTWIALVPSDEFYDVIESDGTYVYANSLYTPGVQRLHLDDPSAAWTKVDELPTWGYRAFAFGAGHAFAANTEHVFHSVDNGATWTQHGDFDVRDLLVVGDALYVATTKGIQVSTDHGATWTAGPTAPYSIEPGFVLASDGDHVFAAGDGLARSAGPTEAWSRLHVRGDTIGALFATEAAVLAFSGSDVLRTTDRGATWSAVDFPAGGYTWSAPMVRRGDKVFALRDSLLVSTDDGASFTSVKLPTDSTFERPIMIASTSRALIVGAFRAAGLGCADAQDFTMTLYRSTDDGETWSMGDNNLPDTFTDCYGVSTPPALTTLVEAGSALLATTYHDGAFRSTDDGLTWEPISGPADVGALSSFTVLGDSVFAAAGASGVARSTDDGATWTKAGLEGLEVVTFATTDKLLFASAGKANAAGGSVFVSADAGATWTRVDAQFDARVEVLAWQGDRLFAGTRDQSVWSLALSCGKGP